MVEPSYQELPASRVPEAEAGGARVRVIAGSSLGVTSPVLTRWRLQISRNIYNIYSRTPTLYLDLKLEPGARHTQVLSQLMLLNDLKVQTFVDASLKTLLPDKINDR